VDDVLFVKVLQPEEYLMDKVSCDIVFKHAVSSKATMNGATGDVLQESGVKISVKYERQSVP